MTADQAGAQAQGQAQGQGQAPSQLNLQEMVSTAYRHWNAGQADQAELLCRRILQAWPGQAESLHLLGLMSHVYGNHDLAIDYLTQACSAPRASAAFHSNLAEMLRRRGRLAEAETAGRRAVAHEDAPSQAWNNLGIVLQELNKLEESFLCLERAIALAPNAPETHNNLGNTLKKMNGLQRAVAQYRRALELNPNYAEAHSNLAVALHELGDSDRALEHIRRAIEIEPRLADAYVNGAVIDRDRGRDEEALRRTDAVRSFAPDHVAALTVRATILKRMGKLEEAAALCQRALTLKPNHGEAVQTLALVQHAMGRYADALVTYERAAKVLPQAAPAIANRGNLLMELGRTAEALAAFDAALVAQPRLTAAWLNRSDIKRFTADDPDIAAMERLLEPGGVQAVEERMQLHFALGKAHLDAGDAERAFAHLAQGNKMKRERIRYDPDATDRWLARIAETFSPEFFARHAGGGDPSELPVFVIGVPRSGTTLIEQILASHPLVHGAGELDWVQWMAMQFRNGDGDPFPYPGNLASREPEQLARLAGAYLARLRPLAPEARRIVDKMPANFFHAGLIHLILPKARIIALRRNPVDTCFSCYTKLFQAEQAFAYDLTELGRFHRASQGLIAHWERTLPPDRFITVDYETVVDNMEQQARRLVAFCGLPWDDACLSFHKTKRPIRTASMNQVRQPIYRTSIGRAEPYQPYLQPLINALLANPETAAS